MYVVNAADFHLPSFWIRESLRPDRAAVVAAPILKLCPVYAPLEIPAVRRAACRWDTSLGLDK